MKLHCKYSSWINSQRRVFLIRTCAHYTLWIFTKLAFDARHRASTFWWLTTMRSLYVVNITMMVFFPLFFPFGYSFHLNIFLDRLSSSPLADGTSPATLLNFDPAATIIFQYHLITVHCTHVHTIVSYAVWVTRASYDHAHSTLDL